MNSTPSGLAAVSPRDVAGGDRGSPPCCAGRRSVVPCCWRPRWSRWSGPTHRGRRLHGVAGFHGRSGVAAPESESGGVGGRWFAGDLLLRGRFGAEAGVRRRRSARSAPGGAAGGGGGGRHGGAGGAVRAGQPGRRAEALAGVGDPHRHRHRLRARRARGDQHPSAGRPAHLLADPGRRRRPARDHDHRHLLHPRPAPGLVGAGRCCRWHCSVCWCSAGSGRGGC